MVALSSVSLDLAIDFRVDLNLVKGLGSAFLCEKMLDATSDKCVVVVNDTKLVLGFDSSGLAMSVEVVQNHCDDGDCWLPNHGGVKGRGEGEECLL